MKRTPPPQAEEERQHHQKGEGNLSSPPSFGRWCLAPIAAIPSFFWWCCSFWWCCFPLRLWVARPFPFQLEIKGCLNEFPPPPRMTLVRSSSPPLALGWHPLHEQTIAFIQSFQLSGRVVRHARVELVPRRRHLIHSAGTVPSGPKTPARHPFTLSTLGVVSGCLSGVKGEHFDNWVRPNLVERVVTLRTLHAAAISQHDEGKGARAGSLHGLIFTFLKKTHMLFEARACALAWEP